MSNMMDKAQATPYPQQQKSGKKKTIVAVVIFLAIAIAGIFFYQQNQNESQKEQVALENQSPTPTEKPKIAKEDVKIQILNGTGTPGQAGTAAKALEKAGFKSDNIKSDNADDTDHKTTTISAKENFQDIAEEIKDALASDFDNVEVDSSSLDDGNEYDVIVTTGGEKFEEEEEDTTPTPTTEASTTTTPSPTTTQTPTPTP